MSETYNAYKKKYRRQAPIFFVLEFCVRIFGKLLAADFAFHFLKPRRGYILAAKAKSQTAGDRQHRHKTHNQGVDQRGRHAQLRKCR